MSRGLYPPSSWWISQKFYNYSFPHTVMHLVLALENVSLILCLSYLSSFTCSSYSVLGLFNTVHFPSWLVFFFLNESSIIMWQSTNSLPLCSRHQLSCFLQPQEILLLSPFPIALHPVLGGFTLPSPLLSWAISDLITFIYTLFPKSILLSTLLQQHE